MNLLHFRNLGTDSVLNLLNLKTSVKMFFDCDLTLALRPFYDEHSLDF